MTRPSGNPLERDIETLLASERPLVTAPHETLQNALRRARVTLREEEHSHVVRMGRRSPEPRRVAKLIAVPIALGASWALAHRAGYPVQFWGADEAASVEQALVDQGAVVSTKPSAKRTVSEQAPADVKSAEPGAAQSASSEGASSAPAASAQAMNSEAPKDTRAAVKANAKPPSDSATRELMMLQRAQRAVARREYGAALQRIAEHRQAFPSGALSEEREALRIKALVGLGKSGEARQAAGDFQKKFPNSALQGRIHVPPQTAK